MGSRARSASVSRNSAVSVIVRASFGGGGRGAGAGDQRAEAAELCRLMASYRALMFAVPKVPAP
ncbi:ATP-binding protein [Streptomyces sp. 1331.2]|uniref:ATP-binding protein n=1 Tax=Streptomyces sp. 1331.2 TaxID=1938835 RepID=UPI000D1B723D